MKKILFYVGRFLLAQHLIGCFFVISSLLGIFTWHVFYLENILHLEVYLVHTALATSLQWSDEALGRATFLFLLAVSCFGLALSKGASNPWVRRFGWFLFMLPIISSGRLLIFYFFTGGTLLAVTPFFFIYRKLTCQEILLMLEKLLGQHGFQLSDEAKWAWASEIHSHYQTPEEMLAALEAKLQAAIEAAQAIAVDPQLVSNYWLYVGLGVLAVTTVVLFYLLHRSHQQFLHEIKCMKEHYYTEHCYLETKVERLAEVVISMDMELKGIRSSLRNYQDFFNGELAEVDGRLTHELGELKGLLELYEQVLIEHGLF